MNESKKLRICEQTVFDSWLIFTQVADNQIIAPHNNNHFSKDTLNHLVILQNSGNIFDIVYSNGHIFLEKEQIATHSNLL
jgi:hypothetical protein